MCVDCMFGRTDYRMCECNPNRLSRAEREALERRKRAELRAELDAYWSARDYATYKGGDDQGGT